MTGIYQKGQSLNEYLLPLALIACVSIGVLTLLGDNVRGTLNNGVARQDPAVVAARVKNPYIQSLVGRIQTQTIIMDLGNGKSIQLEGYPLSLAESVETIGTDGTTSLLSANLQSLAKQLQAAGEIDSAQAGLLNDLANQGHHIAAMEYAIQSKIAQADTKDEVLGSLVQFEGYEPTSPGNIAYSLSLLPESLFRVKNISQRLTPEMVDTLKSLDSKGIFQDTQNVLNTKNLSAGRELFSLLSRFQQVEKRGGLKNPAVNAVVSQLTLQIGQMADRFSSMSNRVSYSKAERLNVDLSQYTPDKFNVLAATEIRNSTTEHSVDICHIGGSKDNGIRCQ